MTVINPFDFFLEPDAETVSVLVRRRRCARSWRRSCDVAPRGPAACASSSRTIDRTPTAARSTSWSISISGCSSEIGYLIRMEPGVQTLRGNARARQRLVPRLGLAAGADAAAPGLRGALRLGLPDSAHGRREVARRPERAGRRLHRPARLGRGLSARAPAGSGSTRRRGLFAGEGHIPLACTPEPTQRRADHRQRRARCEVRVRPRDERRRGSTKIRASRSRTPTSSGSAIDALGDSVDERACAPATCGSRWAASRRSSRSTTWKARSGTPPRSGRTSGGWPASLFARLRDTLRARRAAALRPGQVVSGRIAAALGVQLLLADRRRADLARSERWSPIRDRDYGYDDRRRRSDSPTRWPSGSASIRSHVHRRLRGRAGTTCWKERRLPVNVDPERQQAGRSRRSASGLRRVFEQGLGKPVGLRAAAAARGRARTDRSGRAGCGCCGREHLFLIPGDSPMGFRLPLQSRCRGSPRTSVQTVWTIDPDGARSRSPLPRAAARLRSSQPASAAATTRGTRRQSSTHEPHVLDAGCRTGPVVRTALCVEPREGVLRVFLPPVASAEDYLELVAADRRHGRAARRCRC